MPGTGRSPKLYNGPLVEDLLVNFPQSQCELQREGAHPVSPAAGDQTRADGEMGRKSDLKTFKVLRSSHTLTLLCDLGQTASPL